MFSEGKPRGSNRQQGSTISRNSVLDESVQLLEEKNRKIQELESLIQTISRGKYMWESTFDAITSPVMIISADYKIQRANRAAAQASKIDVREMIGTTCYKTLGGNKQPCRGCPMRETLDSKKSHVFSLDAFKKSARQYEVNSYPLTSGDHKDQVVLHYRDVTEERELQRQLLQNEKMAAIGVLAGGVAHEINNPLGGILAFTQLALRNLADDHSARSDLREVEDAALRCKRIVQDLLDFSRQNRDEVTEPIQLTDVLNKIIPLIQVQARSSRIEVVCDLAPDLPRIRGSFHKLQQVFLNLVTNAYQAMETGGRLTLKTYTTHGGKRVCAQVSDTGHGVSEEDLEKIFDPYFSTKSQGEGTGLGLSITYGIVQEHKGHIEVKSRKQEGTTFTLSFPPLDEKTGSKKQ